MSKKITFAVLLIIVQNICFATMFSPLSFDKQVEEATSAAEVKLENSKVFKNASGLIMTEYSFNVLESYNLSDEDLDNQKLILSLPGGTFDGITSMVDGAPRFNKGDKSFLLLKKIDSRIYLSNFTLGKFKIQNDKGKDYYVSEVFPLDPKVGKISKEKMIELMKNKWKITLIIPKIMPAHGIASETKPRSIIKSIHDFDGDFEEHLERKPAEAISITNERVPIFFWGATTVFILLFGFIFFKLGKNEDLNKRE